MPFEAPSTGSREVEPQPKSRRRSPSDQRRKARRAFLRALETAKEIEGTANQRQRRRILREANAATALDTDLVLLYQRFGDDKRRIVKSGGASNGTPYKGRTWNAR